MRKVVRPMSSGDLSADMLNDLSICQPVSQPVCACSHPEGQSMAVCSVLICGGQQGKGLSLKQAEGIYQQHTACFS